MVSVFAMPTLDQSEPRDGYHTPPPSSVRALRSEDGPEIQTWLLSATIYDMQLCVEQLTRLQAFPDPLPPVYLKELPTGVPLDITDDEDERQDCIVLGSDLRPEEVADVIMAAAFAVETSPNVAECELWRRVAARPGSPTAPTKYVIDCCSSRSVISRKLARKIKQCMIFTIVGDVEHGERCSLPINQLDHKAALLDQVGQQGVPRLAVLAW